jgi:hypothetical protein
MICIRPRFIHIKLRFFNRILADVTASLFHIYTLHTSYNHYTLLFYSIALLILINVSLSLLNCRSYFTKFKLSLILYEFLSKYNLTSYLKFWFSPIFILPTYSFSFYRFRRLYFIYVVNRFIKATSKFLSFILPLRISLIAYIILILKLIINSLDVDNVNFHLMLIINSLDVFQHPNKKKCLIVIFNSRILILFYAIHWTSLVKVRQFETNSVKKTREKMWLLDHWLLLIALYENASLCTV